MTDPTYLTDEEYASIYSRVPRVCVDLLIQREDGAILLTQRTIEPYVGHWHLPGGRIKFQEPVEAALRRISLTELGVTKDFWPSSYLGVMEFLHEVQQGQPRHSVSVVRLLPVDQAFLTELCPKEPYLWVADVLPEPMLPEHGVFLTRYLAK